MKKFLTVLCALLLMPTLATANSDMVSISELRQQVEAMGQWTQNDTVNGKIIEINAPIKVPDVDELPVIIVSRLEPDDEGLKQKKKENLKGKIIIQKDQCAKLILKDGEDHVEVIGPVIEEAQKNGAMPADIEKLLKKTGQTHYTFEELEVDLGENLFVPGSVLKKLRKEAFAQMDQTKILKYRRTYEDPVKENDVASSQEQEDSKIQIAVSMENLEYLDIVTEDREVMKIYLSWMELKQQEDPQSILNKIKTAGKQCYLMLPQIARKRQMEELKAKKDLIFTNEIDGLLVRNLEEFSWLIEEGYQKEMIADYMFYGYNKEAVRTLVRRAMKKGFYEGVNLSLAYCDDCGYQELDMDVCPKCGSKNLTKIDRMNGYLSYSRVHGDTRLNDAKMAEIAERKSM